MKLVALFQHDLKLPEGRAHHAAVVLENSFKEWTDHSFQQYATKTDLLSAKTEIKEEIYKFKNDMNTRMNKLSEDIDNRIIKSSDKFDAGIDKYDSRIDSVIKDVKDLVAQVADLKSYILYLLYFHFAASIIVFTLLQLLFKRS